MDKSYNQASTNSREILVESCQVNNEMTPADSISNLHAANNESLNNADVVNENNLKNTMTMSDSRTGNTEMIVVEKTSNKPNNPVDIENGCICQKTKSMTDSVKPDQWNGSESSCDSTERHQFLVDFDGPTVKFLERTRLLEKVIFVISIATIVALTHGLLSAHWLLPYYYAVAAPTLIGIRFLMYWKMKYQYFLIDFCYLGNTLCYIYLWAVPNNQKYFMIMFGLTNGPLAWAIIFFRNSLVFHSTDKMTSLFIHTLPAFLTYSIRWYPVSISSHWYRPFVDVYDLDMHTMCVWLIAVPLAIYVSHGLIYMLLVYGIIKPGDEYLNSFRYLRDQKNIYGKLINACGPKFTWAMYYMFYWTYCVITLAFSLLWYKYFIAHSIFIATMCILSTWNGASYYMDVFSVRGFKDES